MTIYTFKPTFLYIKRHKVTGLLYFGKTSKKDVTKYNGSGKHWKRHIQKHGTEHIETIWFCLFLDQETCSDFALKFSNQENIVDSSEWANLVTENAMDGAPPGHKGHIFTETELEKMSNGCKAVWERDGYREKMKKIRKEQANRPEVKEKNRNNAKNRKWTAAQREKMMSFLTSETNRKETSLRMSSMIRTTEHCSRISKTLTGKPKSQTHLQNAIYSKYAKYHNVCRIHDQKIMTLKNFIRSEAYLTVDGRKKSQEHKNKIGWATHNMLCVLETREIISRKKFMKKYSNDCEVQGTFG